MERKRKGKVLTVLLVFSSALLVTTASFRYERMGPDEKILSAMFRVIAAMCFVVVVAYCTRIQDELQQKIMQSSLLTGLAASFVSLIFTDTLYHLAPRIVAVREVEQLWIFTFVLGYAVGHFFIKRKYAG